MKLLKKLFPIILIVLGVGGYFYYTGALNSSTISSSFTDQPLSQAGSLVQNSTNVLGVASKNALDKAVDYYQDISGNQEEALINNMVENISKQLKGLPENQANKIKYQFCQDVISEMETTQ